jgi:hypothetical protein
MAPRLHSERHAKAVEATPAATPVEAAETFEAVKTAQTAEAVKASRRLVRTGLARMAKRLTSDAAHRWPLRVLTFDDFHAQFAVARALASGR